MKKIMLLVVALGFMLISCTTATTIATTDTTVATTTTVQTTSTTTIATTVEVFTVSFNSDGGDAVEAQNVNVNGLVTEPSNPVKDGYNFEYWYLDNADVAYDFSTPVTSDITLTAVWSEIVIELTNEEKIAADIDNTLENLFVSKDELNLPIRGKVYRSTIVWSSDSKYISDTGIVLPTPLDETVESGQITGQFILNGVSIMHTFNIPLYHVEQVVIDHERDVDFKNLTTEYDVPDGSLALYFEADGSVPYVKLVDFFALLQGFIDPSINMTFTKGDGTLEIYYQYYDEDYDQTYDLTLTVDSNDNTITTNDPGFYWAYVYSTATNYGRHIEYDINNTNAYSEDGHDVVYDLDDYNLDMAVYDGDIVLPYYIVNQLFAGSSYYNVYYNYDNLYGIYSLPSVGSYEYRKIKNSSMNNEDIPADLLIHTFNMLAFDLDYFYGLKDIMGVDTYYDFLYDQKDDILQADPEDFDYAIRDLLLQTIDEPHTSYGYPSYFNKITWKGPETNSLSYYGSRFTQWYYNGLFAVDDAIEAKWGRGDISSSAWAASSPNRPNYWFLDPTTVMLSLDDFNTADIEESSTYDGSLAAEVLKVDDSSIILPSIDGGSKYFFFNGNTDNDIKLEVLVKGLTSDYVSTYADALVALGYTLNLEDTTDTDKINGYYTITISGTEADTDYMVQIAFDEDLGLFYLGIIDRVPTDFDSSWPLTVDVDATVYSDSAVYMEMMMEQIMEEAPGLTDIILDLSWNTGGNVGALYRVVGFITDQPFVTSGMNRDTGGVSSSYVIINGVPSYPNLNWSLLITPVTYSAANEMTTIFKENNLGPIIGVQSGGGACSITPILLPNGTAFTMSSNNINAYRTGTGTEEDPFVYVNNEFGIVPDYPIAIDSIYDVTTLLNILATSNSGN